MKYDACCLTTFSALLESSLPPSVIFCSHLSGNKRNIIDCRSPVTTVCFTINCISRSFSSREKSAWLEGLWDPSLQDDREAEMEWGRGLLFLGKDS
jgi:hypothetical protein